MEIFITIIIFVFLALFLAKALKRFIVLSLFITLSGILYIRVNLTFLVSIILAVIILKGCKDTLFIFKPRYKFKERFLGKMVNVLFELNFTIFVCISYLTLINYVPYLFEIDNKFIAIAFISIYLIQFIKKVIFSKGYYSNIFLT